MEQNRIHPTDSTDSTELTPAGIPLFRDSVPVREEYFSALSEEAVRCGLMEEAEVIARQGEVMELLCERIRLFTDGESTSMRAERAEKLLSSLLYNISIALLACGDHRAALKSIRETPLRTLHEQGMVITARTRKRAEVLSLLLRRGYTGEGSPGYRHFITADAYRYTREYDPYFDAAGELFIRLDELGIRENCRGIMRVTEVMNAVIRHRQGKSDESPPLSVLKSDGRCGIIGQTKTPERK